MFTGIVEELGQVKALSLRGNSGTLTVKAKKVLEGTKIGDSIAVNGVCLTVTNMKNNEFSADVMAETVRRSSLGALQDGSYVNLERAMAADGRFGGHIVSGHIDGTGQIESMRREENAVWVTIACTDKILDLHRRDQPHGGGGDKEELFSVGDPTYRRGDNAFEEKSRRCGQSGKRHCGEIYSEICGYRKKFRCGPGKSGGRQGCRGQHERKPRSQHGVPSEIWILKQML